MKSKRTRTHPRIVVDQAAYQSFLEDARLRKQDHDLEEELRYVDRLLRVDVDGTRFVDYLGASESEFDDPAGYFLFLRSHAELVRGKLAATTGRVREKFEWLATIPSSRTSLPNLRTVADQQKHSWLSSTSILSRSCARWSLVQRLKARGYPKRDTVPSRSPRARRVRR